MPLPIALAVCALAPGWWPILPIALIIRVAAAYAVSARVLKAKLSWTLLPIEDVIGFCFWIAGFFGNTISWRGRRFLLFADGRFQLITDATKQQSYGNFD